MQAVQQQLKHLHQEIQTLQQQLQPAVTALGFATPQQALAARRPETEWRALVQQREHLVQENNRLAGAGQQLETDRAAAAAADTDTPTESLQQAVDNLELLQNEAYKQQGSVRQRLNDDQTARRRFADLTAEVEQLQHRYRYWEKLSGELGDRTGDKFSRFAQHLTLRNLLAAANQRLTALSDRYLLTPPAEEDDALGVIDRYFEEKRSVTTLSGGETFLVSLALALGLSDMVSRNVQIESLFIDCLLYTSPSPRD